MDLWLLGLETQRFQVIFLGSSTAFIVATALAALRGVVRALALEESHLETRFKATLQSARVAAAVWAVMASSLVGRPCHSARM